MLSNYKMKEATNKNEAITSICDVIKENPVWLNKCTTDLSIIAQNCSESLRPLVLESAPKSVIIDLFVEYKSAWYEFEENCKRPKQWS